MIITEKQIFGLFYIATEFRKELLRMQSHNILTKDGVQLIDDVNKMLTEIMDQQSEKLIEIKSNLTD